MDTTITTDSVHSLESMVASLTELLSVQETVVSEQSERLRQNESRFRAIFEGSNDAIMLLTHKGYLDCNPSALKVFGIATKEEFLKSHPAKLSPPFQPDGQPSDVAAGERIRTAFETGMNRFEWDHRRADGTVFPTEVLLSAFDWGQERVLQATVRDITERKQAEDAMRESDARLNSILHGSPTLQFVIDKDHRVISWNGALEEYSGIKEGEVLGTRDAWKPFYPNKRPVLADLLIDETVEQIPEWYQGKFAHSRLIEGAYEATDFFPNMGENGTWLYFTAAPIRNAKGAIIGAVETLVDISERKQSEKALKESNERFITFIKEAAMRLKTPLEVVEENIGGMICDVEKGGSDQADLVLQLKIQMKNIEQIRLNIIELNTAIMEHSDELSIATRKFLLE